MFSKSTTLAVLALLATVVEAAPIDQGHLLPVARAQLVRRNANKCARPSTSAAVEPTTTSEAAPTTTTVAVTEAATTEAVTTSEAAPSTTTTEAAPTTTTTTTSEAATTTSTEEAAATTSAANDNIGNNLNAAPAAPTPTKGSKGGKKGQQQQDQPQQDQQQQPDQSANQNQDQQQQDQNPQEQPQEQKPQDKPQQDDKPQNSGSGGYNIQGKVSFYSVQNPGENHGYSGAVACSGAKYTDNDWIAAVGDAHYQGGSACGKKIEIKDQKTGNVQQVTIVDRCAGCEYGHVDLTPPVWNALHNGNTNDGIFQADWKFL
ncbi:uncharacterized protein LOC62_03G004126 [Vanrija pseudolonga]|uniref:Barwin domain-containing protein n=1 Tax=Vanrija pseudolonga TaxID=143232 RepID=A0AAF0Y5M0_9TREE|nr:hypothetical protein LOC62_03G004126 [Vanrija pseudolonga]